MDALLASVMRKLLVDRFGYVNTGDWDGKDWVTVDVHQVEITPEQRAAIDKEVWGR